MPNEKSMEIENLEIFENRKFSLSIDFLSSQLSLENLLEVESSQPLEAYLLDFDGDFRHKNWWKVCLRYKVLCKLTDYGTQ